jgi:O-glycosyl hydrolase
MEGMAGVTPVSQKSRRKSATAAPLREIFVILAVFVFFGTSCATTSTIDPAATYQTFEGWGTSLCWWAFQEGSGYPAFVNQIAAYLMSPDTGLGYSCFRYNIGGGENPTHSHIPVGRCVPGYKPTESGPWNFTADSNQRRVALALVAKGKALQQPIIWEAFSNSPPYWMTVSGCASGGHADADNLKPAYFPAFAGYLTTVARYFRDSVGITFRTLEPFNEPSSGWWDSGGTQEGCGFKNNQSLMIQYLGDSLAAKGLLATTTVSASDENTDTLEVNSLKACSDSALSYMSQANTHGYGNPTAANFSTLASLAASKNKRLWMSENGPLNGLGNQTITMLMSQYIMQDLKLMKCAAWIDWQSYGSGNWGNFLIDSLKLSLEPQRRFYMMAAFSRFIRPGSRMITVSDTNAIAALVPKTGNLVIVVRNGGSAAFLDTFDLSKVTQLPAAAHVYQFLDADSANQALLRLPDAPVTLGKLTLVAPVHSITTGVLPGVIDSTVTAVLPASLPDRPATIAFIAATRRGFSVRLPVNGEYSLLVSTGSGRRVAAHAGQGVAGVNVIGRGALRLSRGVYIVQVRQGGCVANGMVTVVE